MDLNYVKASDVLGTLSLVELPQNIVPVDAIVLVKAIDGDGDFEWYTRYTTGVGNAEAIGMLNLAYRLALNAGMHSFIDETSADDEWHLGLGDD
jgi:hypothetical protein